MIDPEIMVQIRALSEEARNIRVELAMLNKKLDANNKNIELRVETRLTALEDTLRAAQDSLARFTGRMDDFNMEWTHLKTDWEWWKNHFDELSARADAELRKMAEARTALTKDNQTFQQWAEIKISQIGRIFRR